MFVGGRVAELVMGMVERAMGAGRVIDSLVHV